MSGEKLAAATQACRVPRGSQVSPSPWAGRAGSSRSPLAPCPLLVQCRAQQWLRTLWPIPASLRGFTPQTTLPAALPAAFLAPWCGSPLSCSTNTSPSSPAAFPTPQFLLCSSKAGLSTHRHNTLPLQVSLASLAMRSMARLASGACRAPRDRLAGQACPVPLVCRDFVNRPLAWEPRHTLLQG